MIKQRLRHIESLLNHLDRHQRKPFSGPRQLQTVQDVVDVLEEQVEALRAEPWVDTVAKARAIGYLAGIARKAIEVSALATRLEVLEGILKGRKDT